MKYPWEIHHHVASPSDFAWVMGKMMHSEGRFLSHDMD